MEVDTERLILRPFGEGDLADVVALNADPEVMRFFPACLTADESAEAMKRWNQRLLDRGIGMLCARERDTADFVGIIGVQWVPFQAAFTPAVEVGWRLARRHWGKGYATEGAAACLDHVFGTTGLDAVLAMAVPSNHASTAVMRRLGMVEIGRFDHPVVPEGSRLRRHVIYRIGAEAWRARAAG